MDVKKVVKERYSEGAKAVQASLCCPVTYDAQYLKNIPEEIIEKDYGCGDPSAYVKPGDTVLDLGSGGGKVCYITAQIVGSEGHVFGLDMNDDMLALARRYQGQMSELLGGERVSFIKGHIQDLATNLEATQTYIKDNPATDNDSLQGFLEWQTTQRRENPLFTNESIDIIISNCVLNLVEEESRTQMIREIFRVLKPGGRVAISDIISDSDVPEALKQDKELWSGCISGAFSEQGFLEAFEAAGFIGCAYDKWDATPWQTIENLHFRSATLTATKPKPTPEKMASEESLALYKGAYASIETDNGEVLLKGLRSSVSPQTAQAIRLGVYGEDLILVEEAGGNKKSSCC